MIRARDLHEHADLFGNGPNAATLQKAGDRGGSCPFSLLEKIRGKSQPIRAIQFLGLLRVPQGKNAGKPLKLADFQRKFVKGALSKGVMVGVLSIGRGNAKTALSAGLALAELVGALDVKPQPQREVIIAARNRDQAKTAFSFILGFIQGLPEADQAQFIIRRGSKLEIEFEGNGGGLVRVIAADGKSILGGAPTLAIMDERAAWVRDKGDDLENAILSGLGSSVGQKLDVQIAALTGAGVSTPDTLNRFASWRRLPFSVRKSPKDASLTSGRDALSEAVVWCSRA